MSNYILHRVRREVNIIIINSLLVAAAYQKYPNYYFNNFRACDACEEWYHGDCINISEREAKYIKNYFCDRCREEDPTLKTRFRPQKRENDGEVGEFMFNVVITT